MAFKAGKRRDRVTIQKPTAGAADSYGETVDTWSPHIRAWADVGRKKMVENQKAGQVTARAEVRVDMPYRESVTETMRLEFGSRTLDIKSIIHDERKRVMTLRCEEQV